MVKDQIVINSHERNIIVVNGEKYILEKEIGKKIDGVEHSDRVVFKKYDEEQSLWLHEQLSGWGRNYHKAIYLDFKIGPREQWIAYTRQCAQELGWQFLELEGDPTLVKKLVNMDWDAENFLIVPAGTELKLSYDEGLVKCQNL